MEKIYPTILMAVAVVIALLSLSCNSHSGQPVYNGKYLSKWLDDVENEKPNHENEQAREAIRQIGTNALPFLLKEISDPGELWNAVTTTNSNSYRKTKKAYIRRSDIGIGFRILGPIAKPAIPALIDLLNNGNNPQSAAEALAFVDSQMGAVALADALTNAVAERRIAAAGALIFVGTNADIAVPNLIKCLKNQSPEKEIMATTLGEIRGRPDITVPALVQMLSDKDFKAKGEIIGELGEFGQDAASAIPALKLATNNPNQYVRSEAATALKQIQASLK